MRLSQPMNDITTIKFTAPCLSRVFGIHHPEPGQLVAIDGARYLITEYDSDSRLYSADKEPRHMHGTVLWRASCSCGYTSSLGTPRKERASDMARQHEQQPGPLYPPHIRYHCVARPYWHN